VHLVSEEGTLSIRRRKV